MAGLGIGGILPCVIAMLTDYAPKKRANTMVAVVMCFFSVGGILAAFVAMLLLPAFGWQSRLLGCRASPALPALHVEVLPGLPGHAPAKGKFEELRSTLSKINNQAALPAAAEFTGLQEKEPGSPVGALFKNRRALGTLMIWVAFFMCLLMVNG